MKTIFTLLFFLASFTISAQTQIIEHTYGFGFGGNGHDMSRAIVMDNHENIFIGGSTLSSGIDFDPGVHDSKDSTLIYGDGILAKYDNDGFYLWSMIIPSTDFCNISDLVVDDEGGVIAVGNFTKTTSFDPEGVQELTSGTLSDGFVVRYDADGKFDYVFSIHGEGSTSIFSVALDSEGNIIIGGNQSGTSDFNPSGATNNLTTQVAGAFLAKYSKEGAFINAWVSNTIGGGNIHLIDLVVNSKDEITITGSVQGEFDMDPAAGENKFSGDQVDAYIAHYNANLEHIWGYPITGSSHENAYGLALDNDDNIYAIGRYKGSIDLDPTSGTNIVDNNNTYNGYIIKMDRSGLYRNGRAFQNQGDNKFSCIRYSFGSLRIIGTFNGLFNLDGVDMITNGSAADVFYTDLDTDLQVQKAFHFGGAGLQDVEPNGLAVKGPIIYISGSYEDLGIDFGQPGFPILGPDNQGSRDIFLARYDVMYISVVSKEKTILKIYPNPTREHLYFEGADITNVQVLNVWGQTVMDKEVTNNTLDVSELPAGVYFLQTNNYTQKFIVE